jgi:hypothetical protein
VSYLALDRDLLTSSTWATGTPAQIKVWIYLLLQADPRSGIVEDAAPAIALRCGLSLADVEGALEWLAAPDLYSRTKDHEGRRIAIGADGILVLNYLARAKKDHSTERVRRFRARQAEQEPEVLEGQEEPEAGADDETRNAVSYVPGNGRNEEQEQEHGDGDGERIAAKGRRSTARRRKALEALPNVAAVAESYRDALGRRSVTLATLEAARRGLDAGATVEDLQRIGRAVGAAMRTPGLAPSGGLLAWIVEHSKVDAEYLFRPDNLDKLATEAEAVLRSAEPAPLPKREPEPTGPQFFGKRKEAV